MLMFASCFQGFIYVIASTVKTLNKRVDLEQSEEQRVGWKGVISKPNNITIGVPQGSILEPCFLYYL